MLTSLARAIFIHCSGSSRGHFIQKHALAHPKHSHVGPDHFLKNICFANVIYLGYGSRGHFIDMLVRAFHKKHMLHIAFHKHFLVNISLTYLINDFSQ